MLVLVTLMGMSVVNAEIRRGEDTFTGTKRINSVVSGNPTELQSLIFAKIPQSKNIDYEITAVRTTFKDFIFTDTFMEIKIDDNPILQLPVKEAKKMSLVKESDIFSNVVVSVPNDVVEKIKDAKRVACRFQIASGSYVYVLPDAVLAEWKQVINTEK